MTATGSQEASAQNAKVKMNFPRPPVFSDTHQEREYLKGRLAAAFRIFGKNGYDEGKPGQPLIKLINVLTSQQVLLATSPFVTPSNQPRSG